MSVWEATKDAFEDHPFIVIGGLAIGVLAIFYLKNRGSSGQQPANFTFSYGPSDAQVKAGTDLAIAQAGDNAALAQATLQANTSTTVAGDYFSYLTGANNNAAKTAQQSSTNSLLANEYDTLLGLQGNEFDTSAKLQANEYANNLTYLSNDYANLLKAGATSGNATSITAIKPLSGI